MPSTMRFPNSARAAWLLKNPKRAHPYLNPMDLEARAQAREVRILAVELGRGLKEATLEQLHQVAALLGHSAQWREMVRMEAHNPGLVGRTTLRSIR